MKADNTSAIVVLIDPLGPRKLSILKKKREERMREIAQRRSLDNQAVTELLTAKESMSKSPKKTNSKSAVIGFDSKHDNVQHPVVHSSLSANCSANLIKLGDKSINKVKDSTDNLDDSIQLRNAHIASPIVHNKKQDVKVSKSAPCSPRTKTSPLQTSSSENLCSRTGMVTRSSPQKSPEALKLHQSITSVSSNRISHQTRSHDHCGQDTNGNLSQKCLQPSKNTAENVRNTPSSKGPSDLKVRDVENMYSSDVKLSLRNLNLRNAHKSRVGKNVNNSNTSVDNSKSGKKSTTKSLSTRISLRLRRLRQKTQSRKTKPRSENKDVVAKTGIKRKMESTHSSGTPASKKLRHS